MVAYQIFVPSFADSNGDGIGDLQGIINKIDYFKELNIQLIWLSPVQKAASYHKYDITDFYDIDPDFGTLNDFKKLISAFHREGIKVIMDLVVHHTSSKHPWFQEALTDQSSSRFPFYHWKEIPNPQKTPRGWHKNKHHQNSHLAFSGHFWDEMPDLNIQNPDVIAEIYRIAQFWLTTAKIDGFRVDAVYYFFPPKKYEENLQWWKNFREQIEKTNSGFLMLGEIWSDAGFIAPFLENGFDTAFNFWLAEAIICSINQENHNNLIEDLCEILKLYSASNPNAQDAIFLSNHDLERIASRLNNNTKKIKLAASILFTLPGMPFVYYGEELGMIGKKPDEYLREPFLWDGDETNPSQTRWITAKYSTPQKVRPYSEQRLDEDSIFNHYKQLIHLRNKTILLQKAPIETVQEEKEGVLQYLRKSGSNKILALHNLRNIKLDLNEWLNNHSVKEVIFRSLNRAEISENYLAPYQSILIALN